MNLISDISVNRQRYDLKVRSAFDLFFYGNVIYCLIYPTAGKVLGKLLDGLEYDILQYVHGIDIESLLWNVTAQ